MKWRATTLAGVAVALLAGCAGVRATTPYTTPETEGARAACLASRGLWTETADRYACLPTGGQPAPAEDERT